MGVLAGGDDSSEELPAAGQDHTSLYIYIMHNIHAYADIV